MKPEVINISLSALGSRFVPIVPSVRLGTGVKGAMLGLSRRKAGHKKRVPRKWPE